MNLSELRDAVSYIVEYNEGQADQSYAGSTAQPWKRVDAAINEAYREEIRVASRMMSVRPFLRQFAVTWPADAATLAIPNQVLGATIVAVRDDTSSTPGPVVQIQPYLDEPGGFYLYDGVTWGWAPTPTAAKSLVVVYVATPEKLTAPDDVPTLVPNNDHDLLVWSSAVILAQIADEDTIPQRWVNRRDELRLQFHKQVALGTPMGRPAPGITHY
jgi:hypothetical protein